MNAQVVAVNPGSLASHQAYANKFGFNFPVCVDADKRVAEAYGVLMDDGDTERVVFVVDIHGKVSWVKVGLPDTLEILAAIKAAG